MLTFKLVSIIDQHGLSPNDRSQSMWQRFVINLAKYRSASTLTASVHDAIMVLGANGIVEDFTILPRLLRDSMIIETWEGTHNTLCLQIVRDAAKSDLLDRWRSEIGVTLGEWPAEFLSQTRARFEQAFNQAVQELESNRLSDRTWAEKNARRVVDVFGALLEVAWMVSFALRGSLDEDATPALLTAVSAQLLLPGPRKLDGSAVSDFWPLLIDETAVKMSLSEL
jgi:hypothetical protein